MSKNFVLIILGLLFYSFIFEPLYAEDSLYIPDIEIYMQIGSAGSPYISPDGRTVYFTTWLTGVTQLYRVNAEGGWPLTLIRIQKIQNISL